MSSSPIKTLTVVIPALNEDGRIADTVNEVLEICRCELGGFEIVLIDDGSTDQTGALMEQLARQDPRIRVVHHGAPRGVGAGFLGALDRAQFDSITLVPGDNAYRADGIRRLVEKVGTADIVISYRDNQSDRSVLRSGMSHTLKTILNILFGFRLHDYHSMIVYPVRWLRKFDLEAQGYGYQIEAVVSLLQLGLTYDQVPVSLNAELRGSSRALRLRTYFELGLTIVRLLFRWPIRNIRRSKDST
ncbi:MAG TPA: glycosyltransferase family 2 protein [Rhizomicrobium sp.]